MFVTSKQRKCCNDPYIFCYICGCFTLPPQTRNINSFIKKIYLAYFDVPLGDQDKSWAPHQVCTTCVKTLRSWSQEKNDSRANEEHWVRKEWAPRNAIKPGEKNIVNNPLVDRKNIILPPLHIKLGLMKQFVKALDRSGDCFGYICSTFPGFSYEKK